MIKQFTPYKIDFLICVVILSGIFAGNVDAQTTHNVTVTNNVFTPKDIVIEVGDIVVWTCTQGVHNVNGTLSTYPNNAESFGNNVSSSWTYLHTFIEAGKNDYRCDPHVGFGMVGSVTVNEPEGPPSLTVNFSSMIPHDRQTLWLALIDLSSGEEMYRMKTKVREEFSLNIGDLEIGKSYRLDFYSDHNGNGSYDAPPADHAWSVSIPDVSDDVEVNFSHNTNFVDIQWQHMLTVSFENMTPHVGQMLTLYLRDPGTELITDTVVINEIEAQFDSMIYGIMPGQSYHVDFFADHNRNGQYDAPPVDHAWRINLSDVVGDTTLTFSHNTNFTDLFETSGIDVLTTSSLRIYPNPVENFLTVEIGNFSSDEISIDVIDITGREVERVQINNGDRRTNISFAELPKGLYYLRIQDGEKLSVKKIVKN